MTLLGYDAWRLSSPDDDRHEIGMEDGQECGRYAEPDDDAPRGWKPKPCTGTMVQDDEYEAVICDKCGETAQ